MKITKEEMKIFLRGFPDKQINGKSINEILSHDGYPLWWFFGEKLITGRTYLTDFKNIEKKYSKLKLFFLRKLMLWNYELLTFLIRKRKHVFKKSKKKKVLFIGHTNALMKDPKSGLLTLDRIGSLINEVREDKNFEEKIVLIKPLSHMFKFGSLKQPLVNSYVDKIIRKETRIAARKLSKDWKFIRKNIVLSAKNKKIFDHYKQLLNFFFSKDFLYILISHYEFFKKISKDCDLMIDYSQTGILIRGAIAAADANDKPSLSLMHGAGKLFLPVQALKNQYFETISADNKQNLVSQGVPENHIWVCGPIFLDEISNFLSKPSGDSILLFVQSLSDVEMVSKIPKKEYSDILRKILTEFKKSNKKLIMKLHPRDRNKKFFEDIAEGLNYKNVIINNSQIKSVLYELIQQSSIVFGFPSTALLEASLLKKPVIVIPLPNFHLYDSKKLYELNKISDIKKILFAKKASLQKIAEKETNYVKQFMNFKPNVSKDIMKRIKDLL